ncbi:MAG: hypothetical protein WAN65_04650 [Candidatus Sulfotelmatobacter sp.]
MFGIILGILGIFLSLATAWFIQIPIQRASGRLRRFGHVMWAKIGCLPEELGYAQAMRTGSPADSPGDFGMISWRHEIAVAENGNGRASVDCTVVNTQADAATEITFPLWIDYCAFGNLVWPTLAV